MALSTKRTRRSARPVARTAPHRVDRPDPIEQEFLALWLGISRLRERILGEDDSERVSGRGRRCKAPASSRKARGQAA